MIKPKILISCPIDTKSGYGERSRDIVRSLMKNEDKYDIKIMPQKWGNTSWGGLSDSELDKKIKNNLVYNITQQPDVFIQITIPNEFVKVGKYNIGITAGMETDICPVSWIQGCNKMDLILVSSAHSLSSLTSGSHEIRDKNNPNLVQPIKIETPIEILFEGIDLQKYFYKNNVRHDKGSIGEYINSINEKYAFLFVGHWLQGDVGHDRKNVGFMIQMFLETFKNSLNQPCLILKTSSTTTSEMDKERILAKINQIKHQIGGNLPNIYLLHGDLSDGDMNDLYNHPKVKSMISFTKGEGYGRPLLEFTTSRKPLVVSNWSGHLDFLDTRSNILINGEVKSVHPSAVVKDIIIPEAKWFYPYGNEIKNGLKDMFKNYDKYLKNTSIQLNKTKNHFSLEKMEEKLLDILEQKIPKQMELKLPKLIKVDK